MQNFDNPNVLVPSNLWENTLKENTTYKEQIRENQTLRDDITHLVITIEELEEVNAALKAKNAQIESEYFSLTSEIECRNREIQDLSAVITELIEILKKAI